MIGLHVLVVPVEQILASNGGNGGVFRLAGVGIVYSIGQLFRFALGDLADVVVTAGNGGVGLFLREVQLVKAELGVLQQVGENLEDLVEVSFQA